MKASIWYISKYVSLPPERVGSRSFMLMREIARMGHMTTIFTSDSNHLVKSPGLNRASKIVTIDGVEVCWIRTLKYKGARSLSRVLSWFDFEWRLWRLPKEQFQRPDVVVVSSLSLFTIFNGLLLRRRYGCRLIFEVRDIWPLTLIDHGFSPRNPLIMLLAMVERLAYRRSDAIVGTMPNLKQHVAETVGERTVHCIPMGFDQSQVEPETSEPLPPDFEAAHIPKDKFLVCHAGSIGTSNALDTLFTCARAMVDCPDVHFLVVGEGDLKERYQAMCADLPNVSFPPAVPKAMVQSLLQCCDLLYFSTHAARIWRYGQSLNKVIDYMLSGRPILASYSGFPSMIDESGGGSYTPADNVEALRAAILHYARMSADERAAVGAAGRDWILRHRSYPRLAENYLKILLPDRAAL